MAEKMSEVFEMYDVRLDHIGRGRGAMLLQTDKGVRQIRATTAGEKRLQAEYDFKEHMYLAGFPHIDRLVKNVEDELITYDRYGNPFVMRMFFDGREMGESLLKVVQRVYNFLDDIKLRYADKKVMVISHGGVCRVINSYFESLDNEDFFKFNLGNCKVLQYDL